MRRLAVAGGVLAAAIAAWGLTSRRADAAPPTSTPAGRYQVVNGTPDQARNIMLLDTSTGETWVACETEDGRKWCYVPRSMNTTAPVRRE